MLAGRHQPYESGAGRIHGAADVKQTVVLERPPVAAGGLTSTRYQSAAGRIHDAADVKQTVVLERNVVRH